MSRIGLSVGTLLAALGAVIATSSSAAIVDYEYAGAEDTDCQIGGGTSGVCRVLGTFRIDTALFGTAQPADGEFFLFVNGSSFSTMFLFEVIDPLLGISVLPNRVLTDSIGTITGFLFGAGSPYTSGDAVSFTETGWSWDDFAPTGPSSALAGIEYILPAGEGVSADPLPPGPTPVPLPGPAVPLAGAIVLMGALAGRRRRTHRLV